MVMIRPCPVCAQQHIQVLFRPKESPGPVSKCLNCNMVFISSIEDDHALIFDGPVIGGQMDHKILTSSNLDDVRGSWEFKLLPNKQLEWPALQQNANNVLQRIEQIIGKPQNQRKILDFGSGFGHFLAVAKERGWNAYGLEPLPASAVYARSTFGLNIITDTLRDNSFPEDFFDVITAFQVFEHLPYPEDNIKKLHNMLRKAGVILIEVPNFDTVTMKILKLRHRHFNKDHLNFFTIKTLSQLLSNCGFNIIGSYHPTRRISLRKITGYWLHRYFPHIFSDSFLGLLQKTNILERVVGVNLGDIITVIGRKQE